MNVKMTKLAAIILPFIIFLLYCWPIKMFAENEVEKYIIDKKYGDYENINPAKCNTIGDDYYHKYSNYNVDLQCNVMYEKNIDQKIRYIKIEIRKYSCDDYIKHDILFELYWCRDSWEPKTIQNNDCLYHTQGSLEEIYWISGVHRIHITSSGVKLPDKLLKDYLEEYPSTTRFKSSDFTTQELYTKDILKSFDMIDDLEKDRQSERSKCDKGCEYSAMIIQCGNEINIRCLTGNYLDKENAKCETTLIMNDNIRKMEWEKLKEQSKGKKIIEKNINTVDTKAVRCFYPDYFIDILKALDMNINGLPGNVQEELQPSIW